MFWILLSAILLALVAFLCGRKGLSSVIAFVAVLLAKDVVGHVWGKTAERIFVGVFAVLCITIYVTKHRNQKRDVSGTHHRDDHVA